MPYNDLLTIHGKAMERDDAIWRVEDSEVFITKFSPYVGLGWGGAVLAEMLQNLCVPGER